VGDIYNMQTPGSAIEDALYLLDAWDEWYDSLGFWRKMWLP